MFGTDSVEAPLRFGFLLVPNFSMVAFVSALEPLRLANWVSGQKLFHWTVMSTDGEPVRSSSGISVAVDEAIRDHCDLPAIALVSGIEVQRFDDRRVVAWLRRQARRGIDLGALCTGAYVLADAGLLDGVRCTIHWENLPGFVERFPDIDVSSELYEVDGKRFTCAGGTAALDMMLNLIARRFGRDLAVAVSDELIYDHIREPDDHQRRALRLRLGVTHPKLLLVIGEMEANLETPVSQSELARGVALSTRQLERLFQKYLYRTPTRYYLELRLHRARQLLLQTALSVLSVGVACGFVSASHFSKCYREYFSRTPREERRLAQ